MLIHGLLEMLRLIELVRFLLGPIVYQLSDSSVIGRVKEDLHLQLLYPSTKWEV